MQPELYRLFESFSGADLRVGHDRNTMELDEWLTFLEVLGCARSDPSPSSLRTPSHIDEEGRRLKRCTCSCPIFQVPAWFSIHRGRVLSDGEHVGVYIDHVSKFLGHDGAHSARKRVTNRRARLIFDQVNLDDLLAQVTEPPTTAPLLAAILPSYRPWLALEICHRPRYVHAS